jgi:hypothetical protein
MALEPSNHTKLMNFIIGMCKKHKDWVTTLSNLGYTPELLEQHIRTSTDERIKPDIVATSNKLLHSIVFECKGGVTVEQDQMDRYLTLTESDLLRWVTPYDTNNFKFDVCISDTSENHPAILPLVNDFPLITFGEETIFKTGDFKEDRLNAAFQAPISLQGKIPTFSYYPFSEEDSSPYIAIHVIRGLVSVAIKQSRGGPSVYDQQIITQDELLNSIFHPIFDALSQEHRGRLKNKINEVIRWIMRREEMRDSLGLIEQQAGYRINRPLNKILEASKNIIKFLETQTLMTDFP